MLPNNLGAGVEERVGMGEASLVMLTIVKAEWQVQGGSLCYSIFEYTWNFP